MLEYVKDRGHIGVKSILAAISAFVSAFADGWGAAYQGWWLRPSIAKRGLLWFDATCGESSEARVVTAPMIKPLRAEGDEHRVGGRSMRVIAGRSPWKSRSHL
jgi:hypothetical protein